MPRKKKDNEFAMENGIRKTPSGSYEAAVYIGTSTTEFDKNGKPKKLYEWVTADTRKECKALKTELENDVNNGQYSNLRNTLFSDYSSRWIKTISVGWTTLRDYKMYIRKHYNPYFGRYKLKDITEFLIKEFICLKQRTLSDTYVRKLFFILNMMLEDALKGKNPCKDIEPPSPDNFVPYVPTDEEFDLLRNAVQNMFDEPIVLIAGWCGLREGEIFGLDTTDILEEGIRVDESSAIAEIETDDKNYDGPKYEYRDKDPKSDNGKRVAVAPDELMNMLRSIVKTKAAEQKEDLKVISIEDIKESKKEIKPGIKLFDMRPDSYSKRFAKIIEYHNEMFDIRKKFGQAALDNYLKFHAKTSIRRNIKLQDKKLPDIRFHDLRHYHTTVLYENDIPDQYIANRIGDDIKTMKWVYQHLRLEKKTEIDVKVKNIFVKQNT